MENSVYSKIPINKQDPQPIYSTRDHVWVSGGHYYDIPYEFNLPSVTVQGFDDGNVVVLFPPHVPIEFCEDALKQLDGFVCQKINRETLYNVVMKIEDWWHRQTDSGSMDYDPMCRKWRYIPQ